MVLAKKPRISVVGQFEISLSKDCQVELVETGFRKRSPSTTFRQAQYRLTSKEFQTDPLPEYQWLESWLEH